MAAEVAVPALFIASSLPWLNPQRVHELCPTWFVGRTVGNWRLLRLLGEGAFGAVYEAQNVTIDARRAAVKILHPHVSFNDEIKRRFVNEANAASRAV